MQINQYKLSLSSVLSSLLLFTVACGGGGGDKPATPEWQQNVFANEATFKNYCELPRSGTDLNGNKFADKQGTGLHEKHWLRAWSNNTYLWYDEIIDVDPASFSSTLAYFEQLKTAGLTNSGTPKDNFHFNLPTEEYLLSSQSGVSVGYGVEWALLSDTPPRQMLVSFVEPGYAPIQSASLNRGAEILEIDGVDLVNGTDVATLNAGIRPKAAGESHTFLVRDIGATESRLVTLEAAVITSNPVPIIDVLTTNSGAVGYLFFNDHNVISEDALIDAVNQLAAENISDLILDLRYNGGGRVYIASQLAYMIAGTNNTSGKTFELFRFNDKHPSVDPVTGQTIAPTPFYDVTTGNGSRAAGQSLPSLNLNRVFVLATNNTCSASEAVINGLRGADVEVILIGSTTCGKPYAFYATDNCGTTYFTIQMQGVNNKGFGNYPDGFSPENTTANIGALVTGCSVADDYSHALGDPQEGLLATALNYRDTTSCPTPTGLGIQNKYSPVSQTTSADDEQAIRLPFKLTERILTAPQSE